MPELPEVETVVRELRRGIVGKKIKSAESDTPQLFETRSVLKSIHRLLAGDSIAAIDRRGKYILIHLSSYRILVVHLKMTGHFLIVTRDMGHGTSKNYIRFRMKFTDGSGLLFSDVRKFGRIWVMPRAHLADFFSRRQLAHDALSPQCSEKYLHAQLSRDRAIKALLLDQSCVAGIGNIYSDEILWVARIHPLRKGSNLAEAEVRRIFQAMRDILKLAIKTGGTSIRNYRKPSGQYGSFQNHRSVYQRAGLPCLRCGALIQRIVVAQRSAHFCPRCQS
ncbi:MAG: bifunctional DNA-formamidopyrimidine glycosylase/DNA-(apurinic or apyrimidinic site) lyase [Candidatus Sungbacteria bacterium]|nr:bifunctional DNA-formamidopyrimidine glycosylase/DNA-(apurinic or apyrimidinic site) lyase [Candidatus Sungbacteria bacterium]